MCFADTKEMEITFGNETFYAVNNIVVRKESDYGEFWFDEYGRYHRDNDLPAIIYSDGRKEWYQNGEKHRGNDLPAVIHKNGTQEWYQYNKLHRDDLPAVIGYDGTQEWYQNGRYHRDNDLPAIIYSDGRKEWYQNGNQFRVNGLPTVLDGNGNIPKQDIGIMDRSWYVVIDATELQKMIKYLLDL